MLLLLLLLPPPLFEPYGALVGVRLSSKREDDAGKFQLRASETAILGGRQVLARLLSGKKRSLDSHRRERK